jgi:hypothetical protein
MAAASTLDAPETSSVSPSPTQSYPADQQAPTNPVQSQPAAQANPPVAQSSKSTNVIPFQQPDISPQAPAQTYHPYYEGPQPSVATPTPSPEQIAKNLTSIVSNPLSIAGSVNRTLQAPPADPATPSPSPTADANSSFLPEAQAAPQTASQTDKGQAPAAQTSFLPEAQNATTPQTSFLPEAQGSSGSSQATGQTVPTDPAQALSTQMQQHELAIKTISAKYDHDPEKAMEELSKDNSVDPETALQAVQFAQAQQDGKNNLPGSHEDYSQEFDKMLDSYINGAKAVGNFVQGVYRTVTHPLDIPNQIGSTVDTAITAVNPQGSGSNPMKPAPGQGNGFFWDPSTAGNAFAGPNTAWSQADLIHPQTKPADLPTGSIPDFNGTNRVLKPDPNATYTPGFWNDTLLNAPLPPLDQQAQRKAALNTEAQQARRTLVAGGQEGTAQNAQLVETALNTMIGIYSNNPVSSWINAIGGPQVPNITPQEQISLMLQKTPIPIRSSKYVINMDPDELRSEFMTRRMQNNLSLQRQAGYVSPSGETFLDMWNGKTAKTPEELSNAGYPVSSGKVGDVAGVTNLALSVPEFAVLDSLFGATGFKSLLHTVAGRGLQGAGALTDASGNLAGLPFDLASGAAKKTAAVLEKNPQIVGGIAADAVRQTVAAATGIQIPWMTDFSLATPIGKLATPLVSVPLKGLGWGLGWGSKLIQGVSGTIGDWLTTAGNDLVNDTDMLATRSPVGNFAGKVARNVASGVAETYPVAYATSPNNAEQQGELAGYGILGHQIAKTIPDTIEVARNTLGDHFFIRDPNVMQGSKVAPPTNYGTNAALDRNSLTNINAVDNNGVPLFSDAKKQTFANTRAAMKDKFEIHLTTPSEFAAEQTRMNSLGRFNNPAVNSRGVFVDTNPDGPMPRVIIRTDHFNDGMQHETAHGAVHLMTPDEQEAMFQLQARRINPDQFVSNYTGGDVNALSDLPTEAGILNGTEQHLQGKWNGLTQEGAKREMVVDAVSSLFRGDSIANFTRNPTIRRLAQSALSGTLARMGFDPTTIRSDSILGVQQSLPASLVLDSVVRDALRRNQAPQTAPDVNTPRPNQPNTGNAPRTGGEGAGSEGEAQGSATGTSGGKGNGTEGSAPESKSGKGSKSEAGSKTGPESKSTSGAPKPGKPDAEGLDEATIQSLMKSKGKFTRQQAIAILQRAQQQQQAAAAAQQAQSQAPGSTQTPPSTQPSSQAPQPPTGPPNAPTSPPVEQPPEQTQQTTQEDHILHAIRDHGVDPGTAQLIARGKGDKVPANQRASESKLATVQPDFANKVRAWMQDLREHGLDPVIIQGGRTRAYQQQLYDAYKATGRNKAGAPGTSYHEFGRAIDWANRTKDGKLDLNDDKAYELGRQLAAKHGLTGISGDNDHIQDAQYKSYADIPKSDYQKGVEGTGNATRTPHIGYFGYAGDKSADPASIQGIGAFPHVKDPGSMIDGYSAGLTKEGAQRRGLTHYGQEFIGEDGNTYRWDDTAPSVANGHPVSSDYIDVYDSHHAPDPGADKDAIAKNQAIIDGLKRIGKRGSLVEGDPVGPLTGTEGEESGEQPLRAQVPEGGVQQQVGAGGQSATSPVIAPSSPAQASEPAVGTKQAVTAQDIADAESAARASIEQGKRTAQAYQDAINQQVLETVGAQHSASLAPDDNRMRYHADSGYTFGQSFDPRSDPFHAWILNQLDSSTRQHQLDVVSAIAPFIKNKSDLFLNYSSAPQTEFGMPTGAQRSAAQAKSAAADRAQGLSDIQSAGKELIPSNLGFSLGKNGNPSTLLVSGVSADKVAGNLEQITHALGGKSPYPVGPMGSTQISNDLAGYLHNTSSGYTGTGEAPITPLPGRESDIPSTPKGFVPYDLAKPKADLFNLAVNGSGAKLATGARAERSAAAFELAKINSGYADTQAGYTNPLAQRLDLAMPPQPIIDEKTGQPKVNKAGKVVTEPWTKAALHSGYETLRADLVSKINKSAEEAESKIHPGHGEVVKGLQEGGIPPAAVTKAGFLPAESPRDTTTEDALKKNVHMRAFLERKQQALDLDDAAKSDEWDQLQARIHDLEDQHAQLQASQRKGTRGKASFMPGGAEHEFKEANPDEFIDARSKTKRPGYLSALNPEDLAGHKLYLNKEQTVGAAVDPGGDIQNVFNNGKVKGEGAHAVVHAISQGGRTLDAFDDYLPKFYRQFGFEETGRTKFNPEFAPPNWDYAERGTPDVVFMAHKGYPPGGPDAAIERAKGNIENWIQNDKSTKYEDNYDAAKAASRDAAIQSRGAGDHRHDGTHGGQETDAATDQSRPSTGEGHRESLDRGGTSAFMPGDIENAAGERERVPVRIVTRGQFLPAEKAPQSVRDQYEGPERKAFVANMQRKAQDWLDRVENSEPHPLSSAAEEKKIPQGAKKMSVEEFADHLEKQHKPLDISNPRTRQRMADASTHDLMTEVAKNGNGVGWYETIPPAAMKYVADNLDPTILKTPENTFFYKVAQAISSQSQDVFDNTETGYHAYQYWKEHGELPTTKKDLVGGGIQVNSILDNFKLVNELQKRLGTDELMDLFNRTLTVKEMRDLGLTVNGEAPDFKMEGSLALGPKIGAFFSNLNGHFNNLVMDLWHSRAMNRMSGDMFQFSNTAFKKQAEMVRSQINSGEINDGHVPVSDQRAAKMLDEIDKVQSTPDDKLTRRAAMKLAPTLMDWAKERRQYYSKTPDPKTGTGTFGEKTDLNKNAKNLDYGLHKTQDAPRTIPERGFYRDIVNRVQKNLKGAGIDMSVASIQAQLWYSIQRLFQKAGALSSSSDANDYLDAAVALVNQQKKQPGRPTPKAKGMPTHALQTAPE